MSMISGLIGKKKCVKLPINKLAVIWFFRHSIGNNKTRRPTTNAITIVDYLSLTDCTIAIIDLFTQYSDNRLLIFNFISFPLKKHKGINIIKS